MSHGYQPKTNGDQGAPPRGGTAVSSSPASRVPPADECRKCGGDSKVIWTRRSKRMPIKRRRQCESCGDRWNTRELSE